MKGVDGDGNETRGEEIVVPSLSSRGDPLRLIYSKGMMRHCVMLNAAFMTRS